MAKFSFDIGSWVDETAKEFENASKNLLPLMKQALYEGARVYRDTLEAEAKKHGNLANGIRVASHKEVKDGVDTKVYFWGYDTDNVPYALKANVICFGRSKKDGGKSKTDNFAGRAQKASKDKVKQIMAQTFDKEITKILQGE